MAVVYEATHQSMGRRVALKVVAPDAGHVDFAARFRTEARMQAALQHPNIVTIYESGECDGRPFLAMQLIEGTTLAGLIDDGALTVDRTLDLLGQIADALDTAHDAGFVHRDIKPRNILVGPDDHAYLADFGLTRHADTAGETMTGAFMGTLAYIAPEVIRGSPAGAASDRYALAAVLFECLSGTVVFPRPTHAAVLYAHTSEPPPRVSGRRPELPLAIDDVLTTGLAKHPDERPANAHALINAARAALSGVHLGPPAPRSLEDFAGSGVETAPGRVPALHSNGGNARRRRTLLATTGLGLLCAALIGAGLTWVLARPAPPLAAAPLGSIHLGSDLASDGRTVDCRGRPVTVASPACTIAQEQLPGATLPIPRDGVVRRWSVRSASGELALSVLRPRDNSYFQIARSRNEFVNGPGVQHFAADLQVEEGDRLALALVSGSGVGYHLDRSGSSIQWSPPLAGITKAPKPGAKGELLLGADVLPGGHQRMPRTLSGNAAAREPAGIVLTEERARLSDGTPTQVRLVTLDGRGHLDVFIDGHRVARSGVPGMVGEVDPGSAITLWPNPDPSRPRRMGIDVSFNRQLSTRRVNHYFGFNGESLTFVN